MKKTLIIILLIAGVSVTSCTKILETTPQNSLNATDVLKDVTGYQALLISVYDRLQSYTFYGRDMALMGDVLADNAFSSSANDPARYLNQNSNVKGSHYNIWTQAYGAILDLNTILAGIDGVAVVGDTQKLLQAQIKAEALALRGMMYFDIARVYGFEPGKVPVTGTDAGFDRSAVIRLKPTLAASDTVRINRSSITETYKVIENDLTASITQFKAMYTLAGYSKKPSTPYRYSESAVHALYGKFLVYSSRWAEAVVEINNALDATITPTSLAPITVGTYAAAFKKVPNPESFLELYYNQSVEVTGVTGSNDGLFTYTEPSGIYNASNLSTFGSQTVSAELFALYEATDDRKAMFFSSRSSKTASVFTWTNKYSGTGGAYTDNVYIIRYSDLILMKAEALANQSQYGAAQTLVQQIRAARNATTTTVPADATILPFIQDERRRELFFEGHRWFDLKRTGNGITKPSATGVGTIAATDLRILAPIPTAEVLLNPNLPKNPGY